MSAKLHTGITMNPANWWIFNIQCRASMSSGRKWRTLASIILTTIYAKCPAEIRQVIWAQDRLMFSTMGKYIFYGRYLLLSCDSEVELALSISYGNWLMMSPSLHETSLSNDQVCHYLWHCCHILHFTTHQHVSLSAKVLHTVQSYILEEYFPYHIHGLGLVLDFYYLSAWSGC